MKKFDYIILGAGVAGLSFCKRISETSDSMLLLEKEDTVGGLARSIYYKGFIMDFCAHRFHTGNKNLLNEVLALDGLEMKKHMKKSRIYMFKKYLRYPFELQNLFRAMPFLKFIKSSFSFAFNKIFIKQKSAPVSYKQWFEKYYGKELYKIMCYPYTSKIWKMDPSHISADWADQRFQGEKMSRLVRRVIKKILTFDFSNFNLDDENLIPDGGEFYYPDNGFQELVNSLLRTSKKGNLSVKTSISIISISKTNKTLVYKKNNQIHKVQYQSLISTIPLHSFYLLQDKKSKQVEENLSKLKYLDIIFVYLFLDVNQVSNDHWLYFPDKDIIFNRSVEFTTWSKKMSPEGKTCLCFDITAKRNSSLSKYSNSEIISKVIKDAARIGYIQKDSVFDNKVIRLNNAYPIYTLDYKARLVNLVKYLETDDVYLLGRTGIFRYNNSDNSIEMGFKLADNFIKKEKIKSILDYSFKEVSY